MDSEAAHVGRRVVTASAWTISTRLLIRGIGLVSTVVLARLLMPEDFGLVAMAMVCYQVVEALSEFNFSTMLLVEREAGRDYYDTVWTLALIRGVVIAALLCILAAPAAAFFEEPRVESIIYALAVVAALGGLSNVGIVDFQKEFRFGLDLVYSVAQKLCAFVVTVTLAFMLGTYTALVAGVLASALAGTILSFVMHVYRPSLSLVRWRDVLRFSRWLLLSNLLHALYRRADSFFIGKLLGAGPLGVYTVAFEVSALPSELLVLPIRRALLPGYSALSRDIDVLRVVFVDSFGLMLLFVMPVAVGLALTADALVPILLGSRWLDAIPLIQILAFLGCFRACSSNISPLYVALRRPELVSRTIAITAAIGVPLIVSGAYFGGLLGAAWMVTAAGAFNVVIAFTFAARLLRMPAVRVFSPIWRTTLATAAMATPVLAIGLSWREADSTASAIVKLAAQVSIGCVTFVIAHWTLWRLWGFPRGPESQIVAAGREWFAKRRDWG
jgi:O-antigen/teichoic acid export membrane protein